MPRVNLAMYDRPKTLQAKLWSAGKDKKGNPLGFTPHEYVDTRRQVPPPSNGEAVHHIYRCLVSGAERAWGWDDPDLVN